MNRAPDKTLPFELINNYGPTENTVVTTWASIDPGSDVRFSPPIGRPVDNSQVFVLDRNQQLVPIGVPGELYISGVGLSHGYLNRPELTAEKFIPNPYCSDADARMYRSGDLVRYREDGNLLFVGRVDEQVKIDGYRIELGEIEAALESHPSVSQAVVILREDHPGEKYLAGYFVSVMGQTPDSSSLTEHLRGTLPEYMVPPFLTAIERFPLSPSGKIDRKRLPAPHCRTDRTVQKSDAPRNPIEEQLSRMWADVLNVTEVGVFDDFFDLGGRSLLAIQLISKISDAFDVEVPLQLMFDSPTIAGLSHWLEKTKPELLRSQAPSHGQNDANESLTTTQLRISEIWKRVLNVPMIGVRDRFVDLQRTPEQLDRMLMEVRAVFGVFAEGLPLQDFLENPTVEAFADVIDENFERQSKSLIECFHAEGSQPPLFLIHAGGGYVFFYRALVSRLDKNRPVYGIRAETKDDDLGRPLEQSESIEELASRYIDEIKQIQPQGPYSLGGGCLGGVIAFEMARQLVRDHGDEIVGPVLLFDSQIFQNRYAEREYHVPRVESQELEHRLSYHRKKLSEQRFSEQFEYLIRIAWNNRSDIWKVIPAVTRIAAKSIVDCSRRLRIHRAFKIERCQANEERSEALQQRFAAGLDAAERLLSCYVPDPYQGSLALFKDSTVGADIEKMWAGLGLGRFTVHQMPGVHLDMMEEPAVINTAALVNEHLQQALTPIREIKTDQPILVQPGANAAGNGVVKEESIVGVFPDQLLSANADTTTASMQGISKLAEVWEYAMLNRCINLISRLGIADLLVDGSRSLEQLAKRSGAHAPTLYRIMRFLCAHGIFEQTDDAHYMLTPISDCLRSDVPWSFRWTSVVTDCQDRAGSEMLSAVRTGDCPFDKAAGMDFWSYLSRDIEAGQWFNREMQAHSHTLITPSLLALDWEGAQVVVDVGGGTGHALCSLLVAHHHLQGILVDQPLVLEQARDVVAAAAVESRCKLDPGDLFSSVPAGADTYILSRVLHDWDDDDAIRILKTVRQAIPPDGRLLVLEMIVPPGNQRHLSKAADISMLMLFGGGRERTEREMVELLNAAGFQITKIMKVHGTLNVIEAVVASNAWFEDRKNSYELTEAQ
jgi:thioesterase domain-containing protein/acyl carrier protein